MSQSPFSKERNLHGETISVSFRLPKEAYNDLMTHFNDKYEENAKTKGFKEISLNALDGICTERKCYNHLELFMLIPKSDEFDDLYSSEIFAFINDETDFKDSFNLVSKFNDDFRLVYELQDFTEENTPLGIFANVKDDCFYKLIRDKVIDSFFSFKFGLNSLYSDLDLDNCYIVRFPLNNYLDVYRDGQYQGETYNDDHLGAFVFEDIGSDKKIYCKIAWKYSNEHKLISFDLIFTPEDAFVDDIYNTGDEKLIEAVNDVIIGKSRIKKLLKIRKNIANDLSWIDDLIKKEYPDEYEKLK